MTPTPARARTPRPATPGGQGPFSLLEDRSPGGLQWRSSNGPRTRAGPLDQEDVEMTQTRRALTDEQREQQRAQQRELVIASIEQLRTSDGWQAYLRARARFPSYTALILRLPCR